MDDLFDDLKLQNIYLRLTVPIIGIKIISNKERD